MSGQLRIFAVALVAAFVLILPATAGAASIPSSVEVVPGNPYYLLVQAQSEAPTTYGQKIGTCVIEAETSCPPARRKDPSESTRLPSLRLAPLNFA